LKSQGIKKIVFCAGYKAESIRDHFGDGSNWGLEVDYSVENKLLGTAGAIKNAEKFVDGPFMVMNGDTYLENDVTEMREVYEEKGALAVMLLCPPVNPKEEGHVVVDAHQKICSFMEKPEREKACVNPREQLINAGVYMFSPSVLDEIPAGQKCSLEYEVFPRLVVSGKFYGVRYDGYFIDIGIPRFYQKFQEDVGAGKIRMNPTGDG
ncbi:MAG: nucleotidyltransferase family protein, partial [Promethearchaeota archaeon]